MKTQSTSTNRPNSADSGYALLILMGTICAAFIILAGTMNRTATGQRLNDRNNQFNLGLNAAEAACEKTFARMSYDFQTYGYGTFAVNLAAGVYQNSIPTNSEDSYWDQFNYSDAQGNASRTTVFFLTNYTGDLPSQYPGLFTSRSPVYRVISNVSLKGARYPITNAVQVDVLLALVPVTTYAIFYNGLLEFSTCATMTVNGRVHSNDKIYTGTSSTLTFNSTVTATSTLTSPANNGQGPWTFPGGVFNGSPQFSTNVSTVTLSINMTNTHSFIDMPVTNDASTLLGSQRLYNQAAVVLLVSNTVVTAQIQASPGIGQVPGADSSPIYITSSTTNFSAMATNFPFLNITNTFLDQREDKTVKTTQVDIGKYSSWLLTNNAVQTKYPSAGGAYPTILYVADNRTNTSSTMTGVRLTNGIAPPVNAGLGFSVATPGPLYVLGNYNQSVAANLASTNTSSGTVPCAFMADALTVLSPSWRDSASFSVSQTGAGSSTTTINAAIIAGIVPSTGTGAGQFSGGVHNLPRLLEDWGGSSASLWLNTSIVNLYNSTVATNKFVTPGVGSYYTAPTRHFSFDQNFTDPTKQPPGVPTALVPIRYNWAVPPARTTNYNVIP